MSQVKFKTGTKAQYTALQTKQDNVLYFCTDTGELFKGSTLFSGRDHFQGVMGSAQDASWSGSGYKAGDFAYASSAVNLTIGGQSVSVPAGGILLCVSGYNSAAKYSDFVVIAHGAGDGDVTASGTLTADTVLLGGGTKIVKSLANPGTAGKVLRSTASGVEWGNVPSSPTPNSFVITVNGGTTEDTDKFTFNGEASKSININTGSEWESL